MPLPFTTTEIDPAAPHLVTVHPTAALPGARVELTGTLLGPATDESPQLTALVGETPATLSLSRPTRAIVEIPEGAITSGIALLRDGHTSNALPLRIATPIVDTVHAVANPAADADGNIYVMFSGPRGESVEVSIFRIDLDFQLRPFIRDLMNISGLAFGPDGFLYASSRAEGTVYRISPDGEITTYAEGMGIATGLAFDREGNLFVGDRSGTIFKIARGDRRKSRRDLRLRHTRALASPPTTSHSATMARCSSPPPPPPPTTSSTPSLQPANPASTSAASAARRASHSTPPATST